MSKIERATHLLLLDYIFKKFSFIIIIIIDVGSFYEYVLERIRLKMRLTAQNDFHERGSIAL